MRAQQPSLSTEERDKRLAAENERQSIAIVDRKVMMPMRDGVRRDCLCLSHEAAL